jgi:SPP1 family predicted phage head-tail adaptor
MRADMRELITFKSRTTVQNDYGEELTWTTGETHFASVEPLIGNEFFAAERADSKVEIKFRCWYFTDLTNDMRVLFNGRDYEILSTVNYKNLNREWLIYARKVAE